MGYRNIKKQKNLFLFFKLRILIFQCPGTTHITNFTRMPHKKLKVWHFHIGYNTGNIKCLKTCSLSIIGDRETCGSNNQKTLSSVFWGNFLFNWSPKHHDSPKLRWDVAEINAIKLTDQWSHTSCILSAALPRLLVSRDLEIQRAVGQIRLPNRVLLSDRKYIQLFPY